MEDKAPWETNAAEYVGVYDYTTEVDANDARLKKKLNKWTNTTLQKRLKGNSPRKQLTHQDDPVCGRGTTYNMIIVLVQLIPNSHH